MRFPGFYGNSGLKSRLSATGDRGGLSHCYLLEGPAGAGKKTLAKIMAAAMECESTLAGEQPCGVCPACKKVLGQGHPDVITVDSDTATVPIRLIREMQTDAYIRPNEGKRKIYLIPRAHTMQRPAQNALLKLLEEPPAYCSFLLMAESSEQLLPTVRSRAVTLTLFPLSDGELRTALKERAPDADPEILSAAAEESQGYLGQALSLLENPEQPFARETAALLAAFSAGDELKLLTALVPLEKLKRQDFLALLTRLYRIFTRAMAGGAGSAEVRQLAEKNTRQQLYTAAQTISHAITLLQANGSSGHAVGALLSELRTSHQSS